MGMDAYYKDKGSWNRSDRLFRALALDGRMERSQALAGIHLGLMVEKNQCMDCNCKFACHFITTPLSHTRTSGTFL